MPHEIETAIFSAREGAGWTGLGLEINPLIAKDPQKIAELLGATWQVLQRPVFYKTETGEFSAIENRMAQVRSDNGKTFAVTSENRYHVDGRQPIDLIEAILEMLKKVELEISHAASLRGGSIISVCALLPERTKVGNDEIKNYVTLSTGYNTIFGTKATYDHLRVVCANTLRANLSRAQKNRHLRTIRASSRIADKTVLPSLLEDAQKVLETQQSSFNALANFKMADSEVMRLFADILKIDLQNIGKVDKAGLKLVSTKSENALRAMAEAYTKAPGASPGNAWGALNAVTFYATHGKTARDTTGDGADAARVASNMFGDAANLKMRAFDYLCDKIAA